MAALVTGATVLLDGEDGTRSTGTAGARPSADAASPTSPAPAGEQSPTVLAATGPGRTPATARTALVELLTTRAEGTLSLLRGTWAGDEATAARGAQGVATSSDGLSAVLTAWLDADLATRIRTGMDEQTEASQAYAAAVASGDTAAADGARGRMGEVSRGLGTVLAGVTDGRIADYVPPQDAAQHRAYVDALEAGDGAAADEAAAWLRGRLAREGDALAAGLS